MRTLWLGLMLVLAGCGAGVVRGDENSVVVSGDNPRAVAEQYCGQFGKVAVISAQPQQPGETLYRCI